MSEVQSTKSKIAILIEKHIITTKIGHLLRALDNCSKTTNVLPEDETAIYVTHFVDDKINGESKTHYKIDTAGKNPLTKS
jgi:hypothetical protein